MARRTPRRRRALLRTARAPQEAAGLSSFLQLDVHEAHIILAFCL